MYILVQAHQFADFTHLIDQSFVLRKRVFADRLGWDVPVTGAMERDFYDTINPAYLFWCDDKQERLYGSVRLLPTTGPTLLYDVFRKTFPNAYDLCAPTIWEGTRMCIDENAIERDMPSLRPTRAFCQLLLALCEVALDHGIETLISNYEPHMKRLYERAGANLEELGRSTGYGRFPVCCGLFEVSARVREQMRAKLAITEPLYRKFGADRVPATHRFGGSALSGCNTMSERNADSVEPRPEPTNSALL